jgi:hypothetical protein
VCRHREMAIPPDWGWEQKKKSAFVRKRGDRCGVVREPGEEEPGGTDG